MSPAVWRFAAGFLVGGVAGFLAANSLERSGAAPPAPPPAAVAPAAATPPAGPELSDDEIARARQAVDARPDDFEAQFKLAEALLRIARKPREAIPYYERAAGLAPRDPRALVGLGDASFAAALDAGRGGRHDAALFEAASRAYERALDLEPRNATARAALGYTYAMREPPDLERAVREFEAALAADPRNDLARRGLESARAEIESAARP